MEGQRLVLGTGEWVSDSRKSCWTQVPVTDDMFSIKGSPCNLFIAFSSSRFFKHAALGLRLRCREGGERGKEGIYVT